MERNILFAGNRAMYDGILSCILSILMRTDSKDGFVFHILTMALPELDREYNAFTEEQILFLDRVVKEYGPANRVSLTDVSDLYRQYFLGGPNEECYCSPYTLLRLFIDLIDTVPDKALYLDTDILFNRDIGLLYDLNIEKYEYAASRDHYGRFLIHPNYINAGVLLLNVKKIRATGLFARARELIQNKRLPFADQSAIYRCTKRKKMLSSRFNDQRFLYHKTIARHFSRRLFYLPYPHTENIKQWDVDRFIQVYRYAEFYDVIYEYLYQKGRFEHEQCKDETREGKPEIKTIQ